MPRQGRPSLDAAPAVAGPPTAGGRPATPPWLRDGAAGAVAGAANLVTGFPFDTVKVTMQARAAAAAPGRPPFPSALAAARAIVSSGGPAALFRGMSVPLAGAAAETAVNYGVYTAGLRAAGWGAGWRRGAGHEPPRQASVAGAPAPASPARPPLHVVALAAAAAGAALSPVLSPAELIKIRLQAGAAAARCPPPQPAAAAEGGGGRAAVRRHAGPAACVRAMLAVEGVGGLTRGLAATAAREVPGNVSVCVEGDA